MDDRTGQLPPPPEPAPAEPVRVQSEASLRAQKKVNQQTAIVAAIVGVVIVVLLIAAVIFLASDAARTALIRDIVLILTAFGMLLMSVVIGVLLVVLIYRVQELISFLRGEVVPMLNNVQTTLNTVRGTTTFVSDNVAKPTIKVASFVAGVQQMARSANSKVKSRTGQ
jgi:uncharacterized membrane protein